MSPAIVDTPLKSPSNPRVRFKNILFATDLAPSAAALAYAVLLARMFGAHLFALHARSGPVLSPRYEQALMPEARSRIRGLGR